MPRLTRTAPLLLAAPLVLLAGCGDDDTSADAARPTSSVVANPLESLDDGVLTVELSDFRFGQLPASVPAGTKLAIENISRVELHEVVAFRITDDEDRTAAELMELPEAELMAAVDPIPTTVLLAAPGGPQVAALGDGTLSQPGRYLLICAIPTGADPAEYLAAAAESVGQPDVPGGPPHFAHGMFAELVVE